MAPTNSTQTDPCEPLAWDSAFFGMNIARVHGNTLTPQRCEAIEAWRVANKIDCLYFIARSDDAQTVRLAESHGYRFVDVRMTFEWNCDTGIPALNLPSIRRAGPDDLPYLKQLARASHTDTRFFYDAFFPRDKAEALYERWIESSCQGYAQAVLVVEDGGRPCGYVTCHYDAKSATGSIGLIAVDSRVQGRGFGKTLVRSAQQWFVATNAKRVTVVTQGRNLPAQRLYTRCDFVPYALELYYHR